MNKEQIKHVTKILEDMATGQFLFFGGKGLYLYTTMNTVDWYVLGLSALIYLALHVIIHAILSLTEE